MNRNAQNSYCSYSVGELEEIHFKFKLFFTITSKQSESSCLSTKEKSQEEKN